jgi:hypothetical protein
LINESTIPSGAKVIMGRPKTPVTPKSISLLAQILVRFEEIAEAHLPMYLIPGVIEPPCQVLVVGLAKGREFPPELMPVLKNAWPTDHGFCNCLPHSCRWLAKPGVQSYTGRYDCRAQGAWFGDKRNGRTPQWRCITGKCDQSRLQIRPRENNASIVACPGYTLPVFRGFRLVGHAPASGEIWTSDEADTCSCCLSPVSIRNSVDACTSGRAR